MGRIQQIQSFSTLDGPGARCVVFVQGCPMACLFCHNPDSWMADGGEEIAVDELLRKLERFRPFLHSPGLTISGGEPLAQLEFTVELAEKARHEGWHVAVDTSGWRSSDRLAKVADVADLIIFSVKHPLHPESISRGSLDQLQNNWLQLAKVKIPVWLRYVLIPGWTDQPEALERLKKMIAELPSLEKVEILPYNSLAESKWKDLGWDSPLFYDPVKVTEEQVLMAESILGVSTVSAKRR